jgi:hypothetical protein
VVAALDTAGRPGENNFRHSGRPQTGCALDGIAWRT